MLRKNCDWNLGKRIGNTEEINWGKTRKIQLEKINKWKKRGEKQEIT